MRTYKIVPLCIIVLLFHGCTSTVTQYNLYPLTVPEWQLKYEHSRNGLGLQYGAYRKHHYEYNQNNFDYNSSGTLGSRDHKLKFEIDPGIDFEYLNMIEFSYIKDGEKIYLLKNWRYKYRNLMYTVPPALKYRNYPKYFKNMSVGDRVFVTVRLVYQFDNGPIITEEVQSLLSCYEDTYNPLDRYIPYW